MSMTYSEMLPLGTEAPAFTLPDPDGITHSLADAPADAPVLVMFISNHCPFVKHVAAELATLGREYTERGVAIFAIGSNDLDSHPQDGPAAMKTEAQNRGYTFPYLFDGDQSIAKAYRAACTPDFFLFDTRRRLAYRGQLDGSRPGNSVPVDGSDLRAALDSVLRGEPVSAEQVPSVGCNIKWRPGNEPDYFG
ncbi:MAG: thioredoxin family protein [Pseudomonadota bacterium]